MSGRKEYKDVLYLIDFGLSKKYIDSKTGKHIKFIDNKRLNGTARYASIKALEGYELSRRDDLEGLCYVLIYFLNGHLPWEKMGYRNKHEKYNYILNMKKNISDENLVGDKKNVDFIRFVKYCRKLKFEENPDYNYLRGLMINCINKNNKSIDNFYNIDINKNPLFLSQEKKGQTKLEFYDKNKSRNISNKNTRCNSTKKLKISFSGTRLVQNENKENDEDYDDYDNKIINESKSSSLGYIEKKVRNYSSFKNRGIKEIQQLIELKKSQNINNHINIYEINKNKTAFRNSYNFKNLKNNANFNNIQRITIENKKYSRSRFSFIKKSFGIEQKSTNKMFKNEPIGDLRNTNNISYIKEENNKNINKDLKNNNNNKDEGCYII